MKFYSIFCVNFICVAPHEGESSLSLSLLPPTSLPVSSTIPPLSVVYFICLKNLEILVNSSIILKKKDNTRVTGWQYFI